MPAVPSPEIVYFVDRDMQGRAFVKKLREAGFKLELHNDHYDELTPDPIWIRRCGEEGWVAISRDNSIMDYIEDVREAGARVITVRGKLKHIELAEWLVVSVARLERFLKKQPAPFLARFYPPTEREREKKRKPMGRLDLVWSDP